jgi:opacity protein-like surface antigen
MRAAAFALAGLLAATPAAAQVGSPPERSPYRDIRFGHAISFGAAMWSGSGGEVEVGPGDGTTFGLRYDLRISQPVSISAGVSRGDFDRVVLDPEALPADREAVPATESLNLVDVGLLFTITGAKTWHGLAPYLGAAAGLAIAGNPDDDSGYEFGNKVTFAPLVGTRFFVGENFFARLELRGTFWKLSYPTSFLTSPTVNEDDAILPGGPESEWVVNPSIQVGLGYSFSW